MNSTKGTPQGGGKKIGLFGGKIGPEYVNQFKAIESVRMRTKRAKKRNGEKIDSGQARLGKKMDRLLEYTSLDLPLLIG